MAELMDAYETLKIDRDGAVVVVTLNRPRAFNALDGQMMSDLHDAFDAIRGDASIRGAILTGARMAFASGADIEGILGIEDEATAAELSSRGQALFRFIERLGKPVVAALNGLAFGGGLELAMACTLRVASEKATFALPEIRLGIIPGYGGTQRLPRLIGKGRAMEMILTGDPIDAAEALRIGLVNKIVDRNAVLEASRELLDTILTKSPAAVASALHAVNEGLDGDFDSGLALEARIFGQVRATADATEGLRAFLEKREPHYQGN